jgi:hypothetical protein
VGEESPPVLSCATRGGVIVAMGAVDRVKLTRTTRAFRRDVFAAQRVLPLNRFWRFGLKFGCANHPGGLRCWNRAGHGWRLETSGRYRLD